MNYLGIDIGGSWIKGTCISADSFGMCKDSGYTGLHILKTGSPMHASGTADDMISSLGQLITQLKTGQGDLAGIGISTAGIVDYAGKRVLKAAEHLRILKDESWIEWLRQQYQCPVVIINDADAAAIGIGELNKLQGDKSVGIMPVGTGLGFSVWRNGRRWRPGKILNLLGSIQTPSGTFDDIAGVSGLTAKDPGKDLSRIFSDPLYEEIRTSYLERLKKVVITAAVLYDLEEVLICGGLADAVTAAGFALEDELNSLLTGGIPDVLDHGIRVMVMKEGNLLPLIGALVLARGESEAQRMKVVRPYQALESEIPFLPGIQLQDLSTKAIIDTFYEAEEKAGVDLKKSLPGLVSVVEIMEQRIKKGGRIIYVGAGTSGRLAAMDAVEIHCTYGFPKDRILTLIAGGIADAAIEIESDFEEDASSIPEMLLLNITPGDMVIGISVSGTAYFVQSALAFSKSRGAYTVMVQRDLSKESLQFCDQVIPLRSGNEVVAGSTRMKAGTSTKKVLNFISSALMIRMGKVAGPYMVDVACINSKLVERAKFILRILYNMDEQEADQRLKDADMKLSHVIRNIQLSLKKEE
jgi:N-acetylmuramic acid 6-phosphate etherase